MKAILTLMALLAGLAQAQAQMLQLIVNDSPNVSPSLGGVWATPGGANCDAGFTLSGSNLIATRSGAGWKSCRSTTSHSSGKWFFRQTYSAGAGATFTMFGIENASGSLSSYLGSDANGAGCQGANPYNMTGTCWTTAHPAVGDVMSFAIDVTNKKWWSRIEAISSVWNSDASADPATGVNGKDISGVTGALFIAFSGFAANEASTMDTTGGTPPSGFSNW